MNVCTHMRGFVYTHECARVCEYAHVRGHTCVNVCTRGGVHVRVCVSALRVHICVCAHMHVCARVCVAVRVHKCEHLWSYAHRLPWASTVSPTRATLESGWKEGDAPTSASPSQG